jgi:radical SAM protein with 4Fe4S-binding SPASM domain
VEEFRGHYGVAPDEASEAVREFIGSLERRNQLILRSSKVQKVEAPPPDYLILELTNRCNLNCIHCSVCANDKPGQVLTTTEWKDLITAASTMGVRAVGLSGGEPMLRKDLFEIASHATRLGLLVGLVTNGLLIDEENVMEIKRLNLDVQVSLDGSTPTIHDRVRARHGCFEETMERLEILKRHGVDFTLAGVATALTYRDLPQLLRLAERVGAKSFRVQPFFPVGRGRLHREELDLDPEMTRYVSSFLLEAADSSEIKVGGFYFQFALDPEPQTDILPCEDGSCAAGTGFAGITHDGYIYPCSHIWQLSEDNVREKPLSVIWRDSRIFNFFRSLRREDVNVGCQSCSFFAKCRGGCKAMNILDGDFSARDYHCWLPVVP